MELLYSQLILTQYKIALLEAQSVLSKKFLYFNTYGHNEFRFNIATSMVSINERKSKTKTTILEHWG